MKPIDFDLSPLEQDKAANVYPLDIERQRRERNRKDEAVERARVERKFRDDFGGDGPEAA